MIHDNDEQTFLCPECGSKEALSEIYVSPNFNPDDPASGVLQWIECTQCHYEIPAHIAERWNGLAIEQAKQQWQDNYRKKSYRRRY